MTITARYYLDNEGKYTKEEEEELLKHINEWFGAVEDMQKNEIWQSFNNNPEHPEKPEAYFKKLYKQVLIEYERRHMK